MAHYDFRTLSPSDFELLVRDLLAAEHNWRLEAFGHGQDGGVDLRGWINGKKLIVQCKHYIGSAFSDLRKTARSEVTKMDRERPDRYLFVTSQNLGKTQKDMLAKVLSKWLTSPADLLTQLDINELLARHPKIERQHFKLWLASTEVLGRIVHNGLWERSEALMEDISDRVKLYVRSPAYERATKVLDANHVVVLTGSPGVGKSMLSEMLCLSHWHEDWQVVSLSSDISEGWDAYSRDAKQIFLYDDFLGQTDISERASKNEDVQIVRFMDRVARERNKRLVMTTRSQILRQASLRREALARGNFHVHECVVEVADYGKVERARILYNHLYFSQLSRTILRDYVHRRHYWNVVNHKNFSPRVIEQVLRQEHLSADSVAKALANALDRPIELWGVMFTSVLSAVAQRIVLGLVTFPPDGVKADALRQMARGSASPIEYTQALRALEGTFIALRPQRIRDAGPEVYYANPSVRDFVLAMLDEEPDYLLSILREAHTIKQIGTMLAYAGSVTDGRYKFPRLAQAVSTQEEFIAERLHFLVEKVLQQAPTERSPEWFIISNGLEPLASLLSVAQQLMPATFESLLVRSMALHDEFADWPVDAPSLNTLTRAFVAFKADQIGSSVDELRKLISSWGSCLQDMDEIKEYRQFGDEYGSLLRGNLEIGEIVTLYTEKALRREIQTMTENRQDEDSDHSWLSEIESMAQEMGLGEKLHDDIEYERSNTAQHYAEEEYDDEASSPQWRNVTHSASRQNEGSEDSYIEGIFRHMS